MLMGREVCVRSEVVVNVTFRRFVSDDAFPAKISGAWIVVRRCTPPTVQVAAQVREARFKGRVVKEEIGMRGRRAAKV